MVCAAVIAYGATKLDSTASLCLAILGTVAVYWLAHLHAETLGSALTHHHHPRVALRHALGSTWPIAGVSVLPVRGFYLWGLERDADGCRITGPLEFHGPVEGYLGVFRLAAEGLKAEDYAGRGFRRGGLARSPRGGGLGNRAPARAHRRRRDGSTRQAGPAPKDQVRSLLSPR